MIQANLLNLRKRFRISAEEEAALRALPSALRDVPARQTFVRMAEELNESLLLVKGWTVRAKNMPDGRRQVSQVHVPGDFVDLHGFTLKRLDHDVDAVTPCVLAIVPHERLEALVATFPRLARILWFSTNLDAAINREWTVSLGSRDSAARTAHLFCELFERLRVVDLTYGQSFDFPLTQDEMATCLGITSVHVNRTLQELRAAGLIELENRRLTILDMPRLRMTASFDPFYLYLQPIDL